MASKRKRKEKQKDFAKAKLKVGKTAQNQIITLIPHSNQKLSLYPINLLRRVLTMVLAQVLQDHYYQQVPPWLC